MREWEQFIPEDERKIYEKAGYKGKQEFGRNPALLIIDVITGFTGTKPMDVMDAIDEFPTSCGKVAWDALPKIQQDLHTSFTDLQWVVDAYALLLATCYRRSNQILALRNSYHGRSFSAIAVTGNRSWSPTSLTGLSVSYVHGGYRLRCARRSPSVAACRAGRDNTCRTIRAQKTWLCRA